MWVDPALPRCILRQEWAHLSQKQSPPGWIPPIKGNKTISKPAGAGFLQGNVCPVEAGAQGLSRKGPTKLWVPQSSMEPRILPPAALQDIIPDFQAPNASSALELAGGEGTQSLTAAPNLQMSPFPAWPPVPALKSIWLQTPLLPRFTPAGDFWIISQNKWPGKRWIPIQGSREAMNTCGCDPLELQKGAWKLISGQRVTDGPSGTLRTAPYPWGDASLGQSLAQGRALEVPRCFMAAQAQPDMHIFPFLLSPGGSDIQLSSLTACQGLKGA